MMIKDPHCAAERGADSAARCPYPTDTLPSRQLHLRHLAVQFFIAEVVFPFSVDVNVCEGLEWTAFYKHGSVSGGKMPAFQYQLLLTLLGSIHGIKLSARAEKAYADLGDSFAAIAPLATKEWCSPIRVECDPGPKATMSTMNLANSRGRHCTKCIIENDNTD